MGELRRLLRQEIEILKQTRDEVRVQLHLGKEDAKTQFEILEKKWHAMEGKAKLIEEDSKESLKGVGEGLSLILDELRQGYERIKSRL